MSAHHELSPSKYTAWAMCPCFVSSDKETKEASEGTKAHAELAKCIELGEEPDNPAARWAAEVIVEMADGAKMFVEKRVEGVGDGPLKGIFGTADVIWIDIDGVVHIGDFKTFSDGTMDYMPQLRGYAALIASQSNYYSELLESQSVSPQRFVLHVFHGQSRTVTMENTTGPEATEYVVALLARHSTSIEKSINPYCKYCAKNGECPMIDNAIETATNNSVKFSEMSLCQKLVVLEAIEKLADKFKEEARAIAEKSEDHAIEQDGIRYELKPCSGKARVKDIVDLAFKAASPIFNTKKGEVSGLGITQKEILSICDIPKTKVVEILRAKNASSKEIKKSDIDSWVGEFYEKTEGTPRFIRVK